MFFILGLAAQSFPQSLDSNAQYHQHGETTEHSGFDPILIKRSGHAIRSVHCS
jgi:hypothetical protein